MKTQTKQELRNRIAELEEKYAETVAFGSYLTHKGATAQEWSLLCEIKTKEAKRATAATYLSLATLFAIALLEFGVLPW